MKCSPDLMFSFAKIAKTKRRTTTGAIAGGLRRADLARRIEKLGILWGKKWPLDEKGLVK